MLMQRIQFLTFTLLLISILFLPIKAATAQSIDANGMVRLVYFLPNDRSAQPERAEALRQYIIDTQAFYADEMERHGYGRKTFNVETNGRGEPVVHEIKGKFAEEHYYREGTGYKVQIELLENFDANDFQHIYFVAIDLSSERTHGGIGCGEASLISMSLGGGQIGGRHKNITQGADLLGGFVVIPASGSCLEGSEYRHSLGLPAHELGHAFGLVHDFRESRGSDYVMSYGNQSLLSQCSAEWLSVSRFFNTEPISANTPADIQLLSTQAYSSDTINLRFQVTDPDGLHQAQLLLPDITQEGATGPNRFFDCKGLNDKTSTFDSAVNTTELVDRVTLQTIDVNGNITWATFLIELDTVVSDQNALDINSDGIVNISDLTRVVSRLGRRGNNPEDVNEDRVVDTVDLLLVAAGLSSLPRQAVETITAADVQQWLTDAKRFELENTILRKGIIVLEHLLKEINLLSKPTEAGITPLKAIFKGHTDFVSSVVFSPDGQTLASASRDGTIRLWDPHTAEIKARLIGHTQPVHSIAFSPDGQTFASVSQDTTIRLWDPHTGQQKTTLRAHTGFTYVGFDSVVFSPDGQLLATGGDYYSDFSIRLWNIHTEENIRTLTGHTGQITSVAFSPDGQTLASGSADKTLKLWNPQTGKLKITLTGHAWDVDSVTFSPDGQVLASASRDGTIRLWNPQTGKLKTTLTGYTGWINPLAFSPDGEMLASGSRDQSIRLWNTQTGEYSKALQKGNSHIFSIAFSPDGEMLASGREDGTVRLWDFQTLLDQSTFSETGPSKITGPWLWMIAPAKAGQGGPGSNDVDLLADASGGNVTEADVATNGAREGDAVGNRVWTLGKIAETGEDNVNRLVNEIGFGKGDVDDQSSYALITLESATAQPNVTMRVGSDDSIKVWLNGEVVHKNPIRRGAEDYQDKFTVDLKQGDNLLLVKVDERALAWSMFVGIDADVNAIYKRPPPAPVLSSDVNGDGVVNILDLVSVSANFGKTGQNIADVNGDGIVNIVDLVKVAGELGAGAAAPSAHPHALEMLTATDVKLWLSQAQHADFTDISTQRGILFLEQLLAALIPKETALLANYPNPFNPETWIPYQLSKPADVTLRIYAVNGTLVRTLALGYQYAGMYQSRSRAAYWDGRNAVDEPVASGVYFYTFTAEDFTGTRKMLIRK